MYGMAREGGPKVVVRFSVAELALIEGVSVECGAAVGGLIREAALRAVRDVGREVSAGRLKMRRRSVRLPVAGAGRNFSGVEVAAVSSSAGVGRAPVGDASVALPSPPVDPGVARALAFRRVTQVDRPRVDADFGPSDSI